MAGWTCADRELIEWDGTIGAKKFKINGADLDSRYVNVTGDTMSGALIMNNDMAFSNTANNGFRMDYNVSTDVSEYAIIPERTSPNQALRIISNGNNGAHQYPIILKTEVAGTFVQIATTGVSMSSAEITNALTIRGDPMLSDHLTFDNGTNASTSLYHSADNEISTDENFTVGGLLNTTTFEVQSTSTFAGTVTINTSTGTNPCLTLNFNDTGATVDNALSIKKEGTERIVVGEYLNLYYGIRAPQTTDSIFFGIANDAATVFGSFFIAGGTDLVLNANTTMQFQVGLNNTEATMVVDKLTFNNGATDTYIGWATSGQLDFGVTSTNVLEITASKVLNKQEMEIDGALNHDGTTVGFYGVTPVTRPTAYTQTYSTTTRTHSNITAATLTDNTMGTKDNTIAKVADGGETTTNADINDNFAEVTEEINALRTDIANIKDVLNQVIDDLQSVGILQ